MQSKFGLRNSERCFANSEFGTVLRKFGFRNNASQIRISDFGTVLRKFGFRISEFGENVTSGLSENFTSL